MKFPIAFCDLSALSIDQRYKLENRLRRASNTWLYNNPPLPEQTILSLGVEEVGARLDIEPMHGSPEVTLYELKEIIYNATR